MRGTRYAILGTGALGGLYGGLLARAGNDVHFLVRTDYEHVKQHGLKIDSPLGNFTLTQPNSYKSPAEMPKADVAVVAWKTTSNAALRETLERVCHAESVVLVLQNGYEIEREAADIVGVRRVLGGCCFLCCNKVGPGHIHHLDYGRIAFGEYCRDLSGEITPRLQKLAEEFRAAGIDMQPHEDLQKVRWSKLVWNIPYNGLSVVLDASTQDIMQDAEASELTESLMRDVCAAAAACGTSVDEAHVQKMLADTKKMVPYDSSMLLDYRARRPIEVEAIFGNPLRAARQAGYRATMVEMLYQQLCFLDARNRSAISQWSHSC